MKRLLPLLVLALLSAPARAGLYNPFDMDVLPPVPGFFHRDKENAFHSALLRYRSLSLPKVDYDNPARQRYVLIGDGLAGNSSKLTPEQKVSLSEYLIRRGRRLEAKELLLPLARNESATFLVFCNLASACHLQAENAQGRERQSEFQQALDYQNEALSRWPEDMESLPPPQVKFLKGAHWSEEPYTRYRSVEEYYRKLLRLRMREALAEDAAKAKGDKGKDTTTTKLDALFADDKGQPVDLDPSKYEPGKLSAEELAKLPGKSIDRALPIVQQLLLWLPNDPRLYWLLGELYYARGDQKRYGDLEAAKYIFNDLVWSMKVDYKALRSQGHRRVVNELVIEPQGEEQDREQEKKVLAAASKDANPLLDNLRPLLVGFGSGFVVALFALWQFREVRRRRQTTT